MMSHPSDRCIIRTQNKNVGIRVLYSYTRNNIYNAQWFQDPSAAH